MCFSESSAEEREAEVQGGRNGVLIAVGLILEQISIVFPRVHSLQKAVNRPVSSPQCCL